MQIEYRPVEGIKSYPGNPRVNADAVPAVAASIREFGFRNPILLDADGVIIAGHTRLAAAKSLGMTEVPVAVIVDLSPEQIRALRLADNQTASLSSWQEDLLFKELESLRAADVNLSTLGFSDAELSCLLAPPGIEGHTDPDAIPPAPERPVSEPATIYTLGRHRVLCLDGGPFDVDAAGDLMGNVRADMVLTDVSGVQASALELASALAVADAALAPGGAFYVWHDDLDACRVRAACAAAGWEIRQGLVMENGEPAPEAADDYVRCHDNCAYGWKDGAAHQWFSDRCQTTAMEIEGAPGTPGPDKPVAALAYLIGNSCSPGGTLLDPFGGLGATLIAAERTGRRVFLVASTPTACDVIRRRWAEFVHGPVVDWTAATSRKEAGDAN